MTMKTLRILLSFLFAPAFIITANAQIKGDDLKSAINSGNFIFEAQTVSPASGSVRQLTGDYYTLKVSKDAVVSDLPYFGRAFTAPIDPTKGGLEFKSAKFQYSVNNKKNSWQVNIKPNDLNGDGIQLFMTVYDNGSASLQVTSVNLQPISFDGFIEAKK